MDQLIEFGMFAGKVVIIFLFIAGIVLFLAAIALRQKMKPELQIENLNKKFDEIQKALQETTLNKKAYKTYLKTLEEKQKDSDKNEGHTRKPHAFVLYFEGDIQAKAVEQLRDEVTAVLMIAAPGDEAIVCVESPGGAVHGYGLAASQLQRLKSAGLILTICVDKVAASGGYMMACTAHKIVAAPFAIVGSIGVLAQVPNFNKLLKKHDVEYEEITSGEYKRTVSLLGEITEKGRAKFKEQISDTHDLFKEFVKSERPQLDIAQVATGEYWFGIRAKQFKLIDEIATSDEYIFTKRLDTQIYSIEYQAKKNLSEKISEILGKTSERAIEKISDKFTERPLL